jgi:hypothetical protein
MWERDIVRTSMSREQRDREREADKERERWIEGR